MRDGLYHAEVGLPERYRHPACRVVLQYSLHALREARRDRYGMLDLPDYVNLANYETVEVEITRERVSKIVVRGPMDDERDLVLVIIPKAGKPWFVKTVWVNLKSDSHKTLDRSRYVH